MTEWDDRSASRPTNRAKDGLKKEKLIIKQGLAQEGRQT